MGGRHRSRPLDDASGLGVALMARQHFTRKQALELMEREEARLIRLANLENCRGGPRSTELDQKIAGVGFCVALLKHPAEQLYKHGFVDRRSYLRARRQP
jgi:hypothetical protein